MDDNDYSPIIEPLESQPIPDRKDVKTQPVTIPKRSVSSSPLVSPKISQLPSSNVQISKLSDAKISVPKILYSKEEQALRDFFREELLKARSHRGLRLDHKVSFDQSASAAWTGSAVAYDLLTIPQGDGQGSRTGNSIRVHKIVIRVTVWGPADTNGISAGGPWTPPELTMVCFADKVPYTPGTIPLMFTSDTFPPTDGQSMYVGLAGTTYYRNYFRNTNTLDMYHVYFRDHHTIASPLEAAYGASNEFLNKGWIKHYKYEIPTHGRVVQFKSDGTSLPIINGLWFYMSAQTNTATWWGYNNARYNISTETVFDDNVE